MRVFAEGFYVLRWNGHELRDIREILDEVAALRARLGRPLTYVAVQPENAPSLEGDVRAARNRSIGELLDSCERVHLVLEGESPGVVHGRRSALAVLEAMQLAHRVFVHATIEQVVEATPEDTRERARLALRIARSRGVLPR